MYGRVADGVIGTQVMTNKYSPLHANVRVNLLFVVMVTWQEYMVFS